MLHGFKYHWSRARPNPPFGGQLLNMSTDYDLATRLKIDRDAVLVARQLATRQASGEIGWAPYTGVRVMPCS
jgi:hypothetical protein